MKIDAAQLTKLARDTRFAAHNLEKVLRLRELLTELHKHPFLQGKLVLKGGTAINLFYFDLPRLSVDIDLNYIAHVDRDATQRERPEIARAVEQLAIGLDYKLQNGVDEHALREWYLNYTNYAGNPERIQIEINFLMRVCVLPANVLTAGSLAGSPPCRFPVLEVEELFGSKIKAMVDRRHPRDLYDLWRFTTAQLKYDPEILRKSAVLFASAMDHDLRTYQMARFDNINSKELERLLYPLLKADDRPTAPEMLKTVSPILRSVLNPKTESAYLDAMATGQFRPELLFPEKPEMVERVRQHPALLWKAENVAQHLLHQKQRP
jgi:predicted nucleotidyltransferase component of viral defense system